VGLALAGCTASTAPDEGALSKEEARERGGKSDHGIDFCEIFDWYGDGVCDDFCLFADPDCEVATGCGTRGAPSCGEDEFCNFPSDASCGAADQPGTCQAVPEACPAVIDPVCGCDGTTYQNECQAHQSGVSVASWGACEASCRSDDECPQPFCLPGGPCPFYECIDGECVDTSSPSCGGALGASCGPGEFCRVDACSLADNAGTCVTRPAACAGIYEPVCGCDGRTYGNRCSADLAGVSVRSEGACTDDCRTAGCGDGRYCSYCWGTFQCIPDGAVC
jgi:hypothetical protein